MSLKEWTDNGWLKVHQSSDDEILNLFQIFEREISDSKIRGISDDGSFNHAYRAALTLATILLYSSGYRVSKGQSHHYRTIMAVSIILGKEHEDSVDYLDSCRIKRNASEYDSDDEASETEAKELISFCYEFEKTVKKWLKDNLT